MVKRFISTIMILSVFLLSVMSPIYADKSFVVDLADVFAAKEKSSLEQKSIALGQQFSMDIVIVTTSDAEGKSSRDYADDYFDYNGYGVGADRDGILFLIDFDNSEAYISTSGNGIKYLTDRRIESILDDVFDQGLSDGENYNAANAFLNSTEMFLNEGIPKDQHNVSESGSKENSLSAAEGAMGAVVSVILGLGFFTNTKKKYKGKTRSKIFEYRNNSIVNLGITDDNLINSYVTTRIIPIVTKPPGSSSSGRSTIHRSSSGRSHGGGGRKF